MFNFVFILLEIIFRRILLVLILASCLLIRVELDVHDSRKDEVCLCNQVLILWVRIRHLALVVAVTQRVQDRLIVAINIGYTAPIPVPIIITSHYLRSAKPKVRVSEHIDDHRLRGKVLPTFHKGRGIQMKNDVHLDHCLLQTKVPEVTHKKVLQHFRVKVP